MNTIMSTQLVTTRLQWVVVKVATSHLSPILQPTSHFFNSRKKSKTNRKELFQKII